MTGLHKVTKMTTNFILAIGCKVIKVARPVKKVVKKYLGTYILKWLI